MPKVNVDELRQTLESQLSLEILLKHDELRLIDQEIAKCQVALEQLRRCSEIPFPGSNQTGPSLQVSSGTGFATVQPGVGRRLPLSPAPWGVTDGPYTRHYAKWLLPDSRFGSSEPELAPIPTASMVVGAGKTIPEGRTTRASWAEAGGGAAPTSTSRSQRSSAGSKLQALSSGYPPPKDKAGPMIIKRKSDGLFVKLVCIDCRRDNFSSTQGFINHCRIAHNRSFASHDAAAMASGEPVEVSESGAIIGMENEASSSGPPGYVHPLIRSAQHLVDPSGQPTSSRNRPAVSRITASAQDLDAGTPRTRPKSLRFFDQTPAPRTASDIVSSREDGDLHNPSFKGSPQTPHLSALMQQRGLGLDLLDLVDDALTKTDIDVYSSEDDDGDGDGDMADDDQEGPQSKDSQSPTADLKSSRLPARTVASPSHPQRPGSRKGADKGSRKPRALVVAKQHHEQQPAPPYRTPYAKHTQPHGNDDVEMLDVSATVVLSPNTTESNQAPSLVSDDGEYGGRSDSESIPSPSSRGSLPHDDVAFEKKRRR